MLGAREIVERLLKTLGIQKELLTETIIRLLKKGTHSSFGILPQVCKDSKQFFQWLKVAYNNASATGPLLVASEQSTSQ